MPESVILHINNLYSEAIEAVKSHAALSAPIPELILILGDILIQRQCFETDPNL